MKPLRAVLYLLAAVSASAATPPELQRAMEERMQTLQELQLNRQATDEAIISLIGSLPTPTETPDTTMPERDGTDTVAVADGGMLFDANKSRLVYLNNVRVADPRMELRCEERLYIQFPQKSKNETEGVPQTTATRQSATRQPVAQPVQEVAEEEPEQTITLTGEQGEPIRITAGTAIVDAIKNLVYLEAANERASRISINHEKSHLILTSAEDTPAAILADTNGDILFRSDSIDMQWVDSEGRTNTLINRHGPAYYRAETSTLHFTGPTSLSTPDGTISAEDSLVLKLVVKQNESSSDFMPQFTGMTIEGVESGTALGKVVLTRPAVDGRPASEIHGDELVYNGATGEVNVSGEETSLVYGEQKLYTNGALQLAGNGDITLRGDAIHGVYARPGAEEDAAAIPGSFSTSGIITFTAATHTISLPNGLTAEDALSKVSARGKVDILLLPDEEASAPQREKTGMLNLAIAGYKDVSAIRATGGLSIQHRTNEQEEGLSITADDADINLLTAEATLTAAAGNTAELRYNGHRLAATSENGAASLNLATNGDLTMLGEKLTVELPGKQSPTVATCTETLTLNREAGKIHLGPRARMIADSGRLSANGELELALYPGPAENSRPVMERYPQLVFNYEGLKTADTPNGGTVQTPQGSMQCSGPIHVEFLPPDAAQNNEMAGVRIATAVGNVAIAGKDSSGRMLRATGDRLIIDGATGTKTLSGNRVTLQDARNTHIASGGGARVVVDRNNNVRIRGARQSTSATRVRDQIDNKND